MEMAANFVAEKLLRLIESEATLLLGATTELGKLEKTLKDIKEVIEDAEGKQFRKDSVRRWLEGLKQVVYDIDDLVEDYQLKANEKIVMRHQGSHRCYISPLTFINKIRFRHEMGVRIGKINATLQEMKSERLKLQLTSLPLSVNIKEATSSSSNRKTSSLVVDSDIVGIDSDVDKVVEWLVAEVNNEGRMLPTVDGITGMGGIGKTTLAQKVFNHDKINAHFDKKVWVCVSQDYSEVILLKDIVEKAGGTCGEAQTNDSLVRKLTAALNDKRFLLVLDDVWSVKVWDDILRIPLLNTTGSGSKILVTTRKKHILREMNVVHHHEMRPMSEEDCWSTLCKIVFGDKTADQEMETLKSTGMRIIRKCGNLPLAVKVIGGVLRRSPKDKREWEKIINDEIWNTEVLPEYKDVHQALLLSYIDLPSPLKQCFVFCSLFPEDRHIS